MVQTNAQMTSKHSALAVAADCLNYTDISGSSNKFDPTGGGHMVGSTHTFEGDQALVNLGKIENYTGTITAIYTEEDSEAADLLQGFYENQTRICVRHRPAGDGAGNWEWIFSIFITGPVVPTTDATSGDILIKDVPWVGTLLSFGPQAT